MSFDRIPAELRALRQWVNWKQEVVNGRATKVPYQPNGVLASSTKPETWSSFEAVITAAQGFSGIGFVFSKDDPYAGIDLDEVDQKEPKFDEIVAQQVSIYKRCNSYTEYSPSGNGLHIIIKGKTDRGVHPKYIGAFSSERYFTFTGQVYQTPRPIVECQEILDELVKPKETIDVVSEEVTAENQVVIEKLQANEFAMKLATDNIIYGRDYMGRSGSVPYDYWSKSEADQALMNVIASYTRNIDQMVDIFKCSGRHRPTEKGRDYLITTAKTALDRAPLPMIVHNLTPPLQSVFKVPEEELDNPYHQPLPGLLGEIAAFIYNSSPRPVPEIALAGAIGFMAGICGRAWNVSGTGLNVYLLLLSETGTGKEAISTGIEKLFTLLRPSCPTVDDFAGPGRIASGPALINDLAERKASCVSVVGEFGLRLQRMTQNANAADLSLLGDLLDLYNKSGKGQMMRSSVYADRTKNTKTIVSPAYTLIGESEPTRFYRIINEDMISAGLLPRFMMIEYKGPRVGRQLRRDPKFSQDWLMYLSALIDYSMKHQSSVVDVFEGPGFAILDEFDRDCDKEINSTTSSVVKHLWNRGHMNALKLASIMAVCENYFNPTVSEYAAKWAISIVRYMIEKLVKKFDNQEIGESMNKEDEMINCVKSAIKKYQEIEVNKLPPLHQTLHAKNIIPDSFILMNVNRHAPFLKSGMPTTRALEQIIKTLINHDVLEELGKEYMKTTFNTRTRAYAMKEKG